MSNRDGVPEVVWALACWRNVLKHHSVAMGADLYSTEKAARLACARCWAGDGEEGDDCTYGLSDCKPVRLWPQGGEQ